MPTLSGLIHAYKRNRIFDIKVEVKTNETHQVGTTRTDGKEVFVLDVQQVRQFR